jgi:hypothetical protein
MLVTLKEACCFLNKLHINLFEVQLYTLVYIKIPGETGKVVTFYTHSLEGLPLCCMCSTALVHNSTLGWNILTLL